MSNKNRYFVMKKFLSTFFLLQENENSHQYFGMGIDLPQIEEYYSDSDLWHKRKRRNKKEKIRTDIILANDLILITYLTA